MKSEYLECGKIINTHGVAGAVKVESYCDTPKVLQGLRRVYLKNGVTYKEITVKHASVFKEYVILQLDTVTDMDAALALKNRILFAKREDLPLPEGAVFIADLLGLPLFDFDDGRQIGTLKEVINRGASDIYVVETEKGEGMIPAVPEFIKNIDLDKGIFVSLIPGLLYDGD